MSFSSNSHLLYTQPFWFPVDPKPNSQCRCVGAWENGAKCVVDTHRVGTHRTLCAQTATELTHTLAHTRFRLSCSSAWTFIYQRAPWSCMWKMQVLAFKPIRAWGPFIQCSLQRPFLPPKASGLEKLILKKGMWCFGFWGILIWNKIGKNHKLLRIIITIVISQRQ